MSKLNNFVAIDWRSGPDRIYFFLKDNGTYSRYDNGDEKISDDYPLPIKGNWEGFDVYAKDLRFGFTQTKTGDNDIVWLFFYNGDHPWVCAYNQDTDKADAFYNLSNSLWTPILPYFDRIVAGTWLEAIGFRYLFRFLLSDGTHLTFDTVTQQIKHDPTAVLPGLAPYKNRLVTAAQIDPTFSDNLWYIFLTDNQYVVYNMQKGRVEGGANNISGRFAGLTRGL
ncbi:hypothetical protein CFN16_18935 [Pseudomonas fluorescens]|uniref:Uncharacterized protein n=1 Tax=Pseudomonas fluorescens TaxID=294 RepID=A0A345V070_PSEFL|nr:hypothetical protein [Pseudomonas fluorescens]AXJ06122.1 hypothetical protein CFN16_18935 [Pseudomonas fluorescens]WJK08225.1 hypothetical protein QR290_20660 [Pseudomonas fluorescens]